MKEMKEMKNNFHTPAFDARVLTTEGSEARKEIKEAVSKNKFENKNNGRIEEYATCK